MCMFQYKNNVSSIARQKGVEYFECGGCPECLQKKSRKWALRCAMESKVNKGVMVTLTYDTYKNISTLEENPTDPTIPLSKKHCQDFIKRLRKHFPASRIKYLIAGERGKRTNRAHYHALLFGISFDDIRKYKKSKRGNVIYKSPTLDKIWSHGICTVDSINLSAKTARYCTKYCAKDSGMDDTFMLFSRGIGDEKLMELFNGKSYWIEGREYSIPREIWQKYIENKYGLHGFSKYIGTQHIETAEKLIYNGMIRFESKEKKMLLRINKLQITLNKHLSKCKKFRKFSTKERWMNKLRKLEEEISQLKDSLSDLFLQKKELVRYRLDELEYSPIRKATQKENRDIYVEYRDNDPLYQEYIAYWKRKNEVNNLTRPSDIQRIMLLDDKKYWSYKQKAIRCKCRQASSTYRRPLSFIPPRSNCHGFDPFAPKKVYEEKSFAPLSRHYTANDTMRFDFKEEFQCLRAIKWKIMQANAKAVEYTPFW